MTTNTTDYLWRKSLARSAILRASGLLIFGFVGWVSFPPPDDSAWRVVPPVAVTTLATVVGTMWYLSRARDESRWRNVWERYAELELAKDTHLRRNSRDPY